MAQIFSVDSPDTRQLGSAVSRMDRLEAMEREIKAEKYRLLAESVEIAAAECDRVGECDTRPGAGSDADDSGAGGLHLPQGPQSDLALRVVRAEFAIALNLTETTIGRHIETAVKLVNDFPNILAKLHDGAIAEPHVRVMLDAATVIGYGDTPDLSARRAQYEAAVLEVAVYESPNRLRPIARRLAEQFSAQTIDERHSEALKRSRVWVTEHGDGMADLTAHISAVQAFAIYNRLTSTAKRVAEAEAVSAAESKAGAGAGAEPPAEEAGDGERVRRTYDEIRADVLTDLLIRGEVSEDVNAESDGAASGIRAHVQVIVPVHAVRKGTDIGTGPDDTLFHDATFDDAVFKDAVFKDAEPGLPSMLAGYGPISDDAALSVAGGAQVWDLVKIDSDTGQVLAVDRYRPSEEMRRRLRAEDQHCRFPGCRAPLSRCDIDHTIDAQHGGPTALTNLAHVCRGHHVIKHHSGWQVTQDEARVLTWTSPTGLVRREAPPSRVMFVPVEPQPEPARHPF